MISAHYRKVFMSALLGLVIVGCAAKDESLASVKSTQYELSENGCSTGAHKFSSKSDYCAGLKDDDLNHGCAFDLRVQQYHQDCGSDWPI
jgi:hypothetical protein